ncbi:hypothetical protein N665_0151s0029 [Sinapis alba]|nr:hypothetical protein N665_0151s0029 [Sinapis alba]
MDLDVNNVNPVVEEGEGRVEEEVQELVEELVEEQESWNGSTRSNHSSTYLSFEKLKHNWMGMWMLVLRTAEVGKENELWFIVNGVPTRYSLSEMALIWRLYCHAYPNNYERMSGKKIQFENVEHKLKAMKGPFSEKLLKMAILYFLCIVNNLDMCTTFPWGHYAFKHKFNDVSWLLEKAQGRVDHPGTLHKCFRSRLTIQGRKKIKLDRKILEKFIENAIQKEKVASTTPIARSKIRRPFMKGEVVRGKLEIA